MLCLWILNLCGAFCVFRRKLATRPIQLSCCMRNVCVHKPWLRVYYGGMSKSSRLIDDRDIFRHDARRIRMSICRGERPLPFPTLPMGHSLSCYWAAAIDFARIEASNQITDDYFWWFQNKYIHSIDKQCLEQIYFNSHHYYLTEYMPSSIRHYFSYELMNGEKNFAHISSSLYARHVFDVRHDEASVTITFILFIYFIYLKNAWKETVVLVNYQPIIARNGTESSKWMKLQSKTAMRIDNVTGCAEPRGTGESCARSSAYSTIGEPQQYTNKPWIALVWSMMNGWSPRASCGVCSEHPYGRDFFKVMHGASITCRQAGRCIYKMPKHHIIVLYSQAT